MMTLYSLLEEITPKLEDLKTHEIFEFKIQNPNYKNLVDLAQLYKCKMLNPKIIDEHNIIVKFQKLDNSNSFHKVQEENEKYGVDSLFAKINKNEQVSFLHYYKQALKNVDINKRITILNLGINQADEFEVIKKYASNFKNLDLLGIDYCTSAIQKAKNNFKDDNVNFIQANIKELDKLNLEKFDLIMSIGTLQSVDKNFKVLFQDIVQKYLKKDGAMILGFPNCSWIEDEMIYGARVKNYNFSEMSVLFNDVIFCKKYLQQKKYRVSITGKDYMFLTATAI